MPLRRSHVDALDVIAYTRRRRTTRPAGQLGDVRAGDRRRARRALPDAAAHRDRAVLGRRGRPGAARSRRRRRCARRGRAEAGVERLGSVNVAHGAGELEPRRGRSRSGPSTASTSGTGACWTRRSRTGRAPTVVTFDPHPRTALGNRVELLTTLERRLELLAAAGIEDALVVRVRPRAARRSSRRSSPSASWRRSARGRRRRRGLPLRPRRAGATSSSCASLGFDARPVPLVEGVSSTRIREPRCAEGEIEAAARLLGRPLEVEGRSSSRRRARRHARLPDREPRRRAASCSSRRTGSTRAQRAGHRAAVSIGVNPHYGGGERRSRRSCSTSTATSTASGSWSSSGSGSATSARSTSEAALVAQIARDVEAARDAGAAALSNGRARFSRERGRRRCGADPRRSPSAADDAHAAEVVVRRGPAADGTSPALQLRERVLVDARLRVDGLQRGVEAGPFDGDLRRRRPRRGCPRSTSASAARRRVPPAEPIASERPSASNASVGAIMLPSARPGTRAPREQVDLAEHAVQVQVEPGQVVARAETEAGREDARVAVARRRRRRWSCAPPAREGRRAPGRAPARGRLAQPAQRREPREHGRNAREPAAREHARAGVGHLDRLAPARLVRARGRRAVIGPPRARHERAAAPPRASPS